MPYNDMIFSLSIANLEEHWGKILHEGTKLETPKGTILNSNEKKLYYLQTGSISLIHYYLDGKERLIGKTESPALVGEERLFLEETSLPGIIITESPCTIYAFSESYVYNKIVPHNPEVMLTITQSLAMKMMKLTKQRVFLNSDNLAALICRFFERQLIITDKQIYAQPNLTQNELANFFNVHRVSLNKSLRKLEEQGIIGPYKKNIVHILDSEKFYKIIENEIFF